ncbi:OmpA family protein [Budviciaceae bacterium CWB-B4]|uniref:OmpA family protein n=1 Tax=Limnobaculum xujianqingii TaxID=2738837 RepID=A0A9D7FZ94_9GAMM|nr:OmpA family protein [Limnobaculum xujianqingii]MBK5074733.1 OmpA family protein [Limnobaculum xujianqingii]MBK5177935.1 OmpA family protein [Limnobaculum xujianqingii]
MFRENKGSEVNKLTVLLRASALGLVPALLAFNVTAAGTSANDVMEISSTEEAAVTAPVVLSHTGSQYVPVPQVSERLAQVVFYRPVGDADVGVSNVYIDREFQGALRNGEYTVFCVDPGKHVIEAYADDAPNYDGKESPKSVARLNGGKTYFIEANRVPGVGTPIAVTRSQAESKLFGYKGGATINRASAVRSCDYAGGAPLGNVLFSFAGKNVSDIEAGGTEIVQNMANHINGLPLVTRVNVVGHADPVGNPASNRKLSLQRAETVKQMLISYGVSPAVLFTNGQGDSNPTVDCTGMEKTERNLCNRANRRVDTMIQTGE